MICCTDIRYYHTIMNTDIGIGDLVKLKDDMYQDDEHNIFKIKYIHNNIYYLVHPYLKNRNFIHVELENLTCLSLLKFANDIIRSDKTENKIKENDDKYSLERKSISDEYFTKIDTLKEKFKYNNRHPEIKKLMDDHLLKINDFEKKYFEIYIKKQFSSPSEFITEAGIDFNSPLFFEMKLTGGYTYIIIHYNNYRFSNHGFIFDIQIEHNHKQYYIQFRFRNLSVAISLKDIDSIHQMFDIDFKTSSLQLYYMSLKELFKPSDLTIEFL